MNSITCFVIASFLFVLVWGTLSPVLGSQSVNIFPPESKPYGLTFAEHIKNFWKWILEIPAKESPLIDPTGEKCANGQSNTNSSVFYLSMNNGGISERTCKVPAGNGLFIPVMQVEWSDKEAPGASIEELHKSAKKDQDSVNSLYLKIGDKDTNMTILSNIELKQTLLRLFSPIMEFLELLKVVFLTLLLMDFI